MTWISDIPDFARAVSEAGGLPTVALGVKSRTDLEQDLARLEEVMGQRSLRGQLCRPAGKSLIS